MTNEPIRVAHVIGKLNAAGVEAVINNYYRNIDHSKYQFDFYVDADGSCEPPKELMGLGARYFVIPPYQKLLQHISTLIKLFRENNYRIVHSSMNTLAPISLFCAWRAGVPIRINHNHSTAGKGETKKNILKYTLRPFAKLFSTHYAACSRYAGEWLYGKKMMRSGKVMILNNAIDIEKYRTNEDVRNEVRKELGIDGCFAVGHVGRFCYQKNHEFLVDIFAELQRKDNKAVLLLIGIGDLQEAIRDKVKALGLKSVFFLGARNDVNRLYQAMDVFILPSRYEGLPVVGVEAQAAGLPCVFSDQITKEAVITKEAKVLPLDDPKKWAELILAGKETKKRDTTEELQRAGFDIAMEAKKLEEIYDSLICEIAE